MKKEEIQYKVVIETSPDQAGTYKIEVKAKNKKEAKEEAVKWMKKNHSHLIDRATYTIQELNKNKTMKKSELRQIIREEIQKAISEGFIESRDGAYLKKADGNIKYWTRGNFDNSGLYTGERDKRCQWCMENFHAFGGGRGGYGHTIDLHDFEITTRPEKGKAMSQNYSDRGQGDALGYVA